MRKILEFYLDALSKIIDFEGYFISVNEADILGPIMRFNNDWFNIYRLSQTD